MKGTESGRKRKGLQDLTRVFLAFTYWEERTLCYQEKKRSSEGIVILIRRSSPPPKRETSASEKKEGRIKIESEKSALYH